MDTQVNEHDKQRVRDYMMAFVCGYRNARPRREIAQVLQMEDRYFREVCSEIPEIITSVKWGYWILPLVDRFGDEVRMARVVIEGEDRRRIIALYLRHRRQRRAVSQLNQVETQMEMFR